MVKDEQPAVGNMPLAASSRQLAAGSRLHGEQLAGKPVPANEYQWLALQAYIEMLRLKNYSQNTISNYKNWFLIFLNHFPDRKPSTISKNEIMDFLVSFKNSPRWSATSQNQLINAIKFFYE